MFIDEYKKENDVVRRLSVKLLINIMSCFSGAGMVAWTVFEAIN
jgi:hypothetical protein